MHNYAFILHTGPLRRPVTAEPRANVCHVVRRGVVFQMPFERLRDY